MFLVPQGSYKVLSLCLHESFRYSIEVPILQGFCKAATMYLVSKYFHLDSYSRGKYIISTIKGLTGSLDLNILDILFLVIMVLVKC